jgi:nucleotide-binding universal stress UspA family protein
VRHILLPLDGTPLAEQMIEPAVTLGQLMGADYTLLRVIKPMMPVDYDASIAQLPQPTVVVCEQIHKVHEQVRQEAETYLARVAAGLRERSLRVETRVAIEQQPAVAILQKAQALNIDLIALATHGRRGLSRLLLGSVADKVLRGGTLPMLVQRPVAS